MTGFDENVQMLVDSGPLGMALFIAGVVIAAMILMRGDAGHRRNARTMRQIHSPVASAWHTANGCTGILGWLTVGAAVLLLAAALGA